MRNKIYETLVENGYSEKSANLVLNELTHCLLRLMIIW